MVINLFVSHNRSLSCSHTGSSGSGSHEEDGSKGKSLKSLSLVKRRKSSRRLRKKDIPIELPLPDTTTITTTTTTTAPRRSTSGTLKTNKENLSNANCNRNSNESKKTSMTRERISKEKNRGERKEGDVVIKNNDVTSSTRPINNPTISKNKQNNQIHSKFQQFKSSFRNKEFYHRQKHPKQEMSSQIPMMTSEEASRLKFSYLSEMSLFHSTSTSVPVFITPSSLSTSYDSHNNNYNDGHNNNDNNNIEYPTTSSSSSSLQPLIPPSSINVLGKRPTVSSDLEKLWLRLPDDPTVEESFECVFSHQLLEQSVRSLYIDDYGGIDGDYDLASGLGSGSGSLLENSCGSSDSCLECKSGKIVQVGIVSPFHQVAVDDNGDNDITRNNHFTRTLSNVIPNSLPYQSLKSKNNDNVDSSMLCHACKTGNNDRPCIPPDCWPQCPLLLRPTPGSGTRVRGVRFANNMSNDDNIDNQQYLMDNSIQKHWWDELQKVWNGDNGNNNEAKQNKAGTGTGTGTFCNQCCILPINNGNEKDGQTLVIDFESDLFEGTLQLRIRKSNGTTRGSYDDSYGFFSGRNRQYQCVISGRFKKEGIPMTECITGQIFSRPIRTPAPYITNGAIRVLSIFAPRLQTKLHGANQMIISPLGSTPQSIMVDELNKCSTSAQNFKAVETLLQDLEEPSTNSRRLIDIPSKSASSSSSMARAKARKKAFDKLCGSTETLSCTFQTDKIYTFEFLQHLINFDTLEMNLGNIMGKYKLSHMMNGQPVSIMAAHQRPIQHSSGVSNKHDFQKLWSFDLWHESIVKSNGM